MPKRRARIKHDPYQVVPEAILADPVLAAEVDVIDLKHWWYADDGTPYAPPGGEGLAPRQQLRGWKGPKGRSAAETARQVRETRLAHPGKAVICSSDGADPVAILLGGGSLAPLPRLDPAVARAVVGMLPVAGAAPGTLGELRDATTRATCARSRDGEPVLAPSPE